RLRALRRQRSRQRRRRRRPADPVARPAPLDRDHAATARGRRLEGRARRLTERVPGLRDALAAAPDPERATRLAESLLDAAGAALAPAIAAHPEGVTRAVASLCGVAPFLAPLVGRHPVWLPRARRAR